MLDIVGIDPVAESTYEALVACSEATPEEIAAETGLSIRHTRLALRTLEDRGVVRQVGRAPLRYSAVDPGLALDVLLLHREEQVKQARARAQELSERFHQAAAGRDPKRLVEIVTGRQAVLERIDQVLRSARDEIRCFDTPPYAANVIVANQSEEALLARNGMARVIYDRAAAELPGRLADLEQGVAWGEQARVLPVLPMKLLLVDDRIGAVPLQASPTAIESTILVHPSGLLEGLSALFEALWQVALPLDLDPERGANPADRPSQDDRRILSLLTAGLPDEAVARQLGMSDRTYQRRIHDLMLRLTARTRFQLARQAMRHGWLETHDEVAQRGADRTQGQSSPGVAASPGRPLAPATDGEQDSAAARLAPLARSQRRSTGLLNNSRSA